MLRYGSLPVIWAAPDRREALGAYVQMYFKEEIQEGWIGQLLRAYGEPASGTGHPVDGLWYWAPAEEQLEVDFLVKAGGRYVAVEAKAKTALAAKDFAGLRAIQGLAGLARRVVVYLGERPQRTADGIDVLPLRGFLTALEQGRLW